MSIICIYSNESNNNGHSALLDAKLTDSCFKNISY